LQIVSRERCKTILQIVSVPGICQSRKRHKLPARIAKSGARGLASPLRACGEGICQSKVFHISQHILISGQLHIFYLYKNQAIMDLHVESAICSDFYNILFF